MSKGENIFKRKDGRWEARYIREYDASGKIRYGYCYGKTYREAKEKVSRCKAEHILHTERTQIRGQYTFRYYCDEWMKARQFRWKESTYVKYNNTLERHIKPRLGNFLPCDISSGTVAAFAHSLLEDENLSVQTVKDVLVLLQAILKFTANYFPGQFPYIEITYPRETKREMSVLTLEQQKAFVDVLMQDMDDCKFGILLALQTGLRIGEVCALKWENIDLNAGIMTINGTMQRLKNTGAGSVRSTRVVITPPKTENSQCLIPMTERISELCRQMYPGNPDCYILTGTRQFMEPRTLQYRLKKYTEICGLTNVHFHTLRHTFATRCVEVGFEIKSLSEILGHSSTKITLDRYVHSSMELKKRNMEKLNELDF